MMRQDLSTPLLPLGVNLIGPFQSEKGIGSGVRLLLSAIKSIPLPTRLLNFVDTGSVNNDHSQVRFDQNNEFLINLVHLGFDSIPSFTEYQGGHFFNGRYNIAFWNWELSTFPETWASNGDHFHEIWVPSTYTQKSIMNTTHKKVRCIPYPISVPKELPSGIDRSYFQLPLDATIFLFAFDFSSYSARKNPEAVLKAFLKAFTGNENVLLLIKTVHGNKDPLGMKSLLKLCKENPRIRILDQVLNRSEMYALTKLCDVFVSLHRCEGFGLNIFEAMAMEKPVIVTGYSANMDYTDDSNSFLVDYQLVPIDQDYGPYKKGELWADPSIEHAAMQMRYVYENPEHAKEVGLRAARCIEKRLSVESTGKLVNASIRDMVLNEKIASWWPINVRNDSKWLADIAHFPLHSHRKFLGKMIVMLKRVFRRILRPSLERQSELNHQLFEEIASLKKQIDSLEREVQFLREKT